MAGSPTRQQAKSQLTCSGCTLNMDLPVCSNITYVEQPVMAASGRGTSGDRSIRTMSAAAASAVAAAGISHSHSQTTAAPICMHALMRAHAMHAYVSPGALQCLYTWSIATLPQQTVCSCLVERATAGIRNAHPSNATASIDYTTLAPE